MFNKHDCYGVSVSLNESDGAMTATVRSSTSKYYSHQVRNENLEYQYNRIFLAL